MNGLDVGIVGKGVFSEFSADTAVRKEKTSEDRMGTPKRTEKRRTIACILRMGRCFIVKRCSRCHVVVVEENRKKNEEESGGGMVAWRESEEVSTQTVKAILVRSTHECSWL